MGRGRDRCMWLAATLLALAGACGGGDDSSTDADVPDEAESGFPDVPPETDADADAGADADADAETPDETVEAADADAPDEGPTDVPPDGDADEFAPDVPDETSDGEDDGVDADVVCSDIVPASDERPPICTVTDSTVVIGFEGSALPPYASWGRVDGIHQVTDAPGVTEGHHALQADFEVGTLWPTIQFEASAFVPGPAGSAWDWSAYDALGVDVTNLSSRDVRFSIRLDYGGLYDPPRWDDRSAMVPAGATRTLWFPLVPIGENPCWMRRLLYAPFSEAQALVVVLGDPPYYLDKSHIEHIVLYALDATGPFFHEFSPRTLVIDNLRVARGDFFPPTDRLVDRYGQNGRFNWPARVACDDELAEDGRVELAAARTAPPSDGVPHGWTTGPRLPPSTDGTWRVERNAGRWWFVTPAGELFWSLGVDGLWFDRPTVVGTTAAGDVGWPGLRRDLFEWVADGPEDAWLAPFRDSVQPRCYGTVDCKILNFYGVNLARKYRPFDPDLCPGTSTRPRDCPFLRDWVEVTMHRLGEWGFNTAGAWHVPEFADATWLTAEGIRGRTVVFPILEGLWHLENEAHVGPTPGTALWRMYDVFDPRFDALFAATSAGGDSPLVADLAGLHCDHAFCPGLFVDNELYWGEWYPEGVPNRLERLYDLVLAVLAHSGSAGRPNAAKLEFRTILQARYDSITDLATAWGVTLGGTAPTWDDFLSTDLAGLLPVIAEGSALQRDLSDLLSAFARKYFGTVRRFLAARAPGRLYLCPRFAMRAPPEVLAQAADHCDVISMNIYARSVDRLDWSYADVVANVLTGARDRPLLVGEFHFGATDRGNFTTAVAPELGTLDQAARAAAFRHYATSALLDPRFVGVHWFEWVDQPISGRLDNFENFNCGIVRVTDRPHTEFVDAVQTFASGMYGRRWSAPVP